MSTYVNVYQCQCVIVSRCVSVFNLCMAVYVSVSVSVRQYIYIYIYSCIIQGGVYVCVSVCMCIFDSVCLCMSMCEYV